jgi:hypothetical protein
MPQIPNEAVLVLFSFLFHFCFSFCSFSPYFPICGISPFLLLFQTLRIIPENGRGGVVNSTSSEALQQSFVGGAPHRDLNVTLLKISEEYLLPLSSLF